MSGMKRNMSQKMLRINLLPKLPKGSFYGWVEYHVEIFDPEAIAVGVILTKEESERRKNDIDWFHIEN